MSKLLVLGGARSGKSVYAENAASAAGKQVIYLATATADDDEMQSRIEKHATRRPANWQTVEETLELASTLKKISNPQTCVLVDCLTLWVSNLLPLAEPQREELINEFIDFMSKTTNDIILVSNEVGLGIVPMGEVSRQFRDETGFLHQQLAQVCDEVVFMVAGLPMFVKSKETEN
jgi:adenosylcobinamide kinase/adenosylcobinamide-phosphate guanylyltransferase